MLTGYISAQMESRDKPYQVPPPSGEQSYGTFQLLGNPPKHGGQPTVVKFLQRSGYKKEFDGLTLNSPEFKNKWQHLGKTDPLFGTAQYQFVAETHFYPLANYVSKKGLTRTKAIDEALFSMGVQHSKARKICDNAIAKLDLKTATEAQIINALYDARTDYVQGLIEKHAGVEKDLTSLIHSRYPEERTKVLALIQDTSSSTPSFEELFKELGLTPEESSEAASKAVAKGSFTPEQMSKKLSEMLAWYQANPNPITAEEPVDNGIDEPDESTDSSEPSTSTTAPSDSSPNSSTPSVVEHGGNYEVKHQEMTEFLNFLGEIAKSAKSKVLSDAVEITQHVMKAYQAVNTISQLAAGIAGTAILGPISALGGAIFGIISLFGGSGPSATEIILNQIQHLSEQIAGIKTYLVEQFKELFEQNEQILDALNRGFFALSFQIQGEVGSFRIELNDRLDKIAADIRYLAKKSDLDHLELATQTLRGHYSLVSNLIESKNPNIAGPADLTIPPLAEQLCAWATLEAKAGLYTGYNTYITAPPPDVFVGAGQPPVDILRSILFGEHGDLHVGEDALISSLIGYLASYYKHNGDPALTSQVNIGEVPNPQLWHDVSQKYYDLKAAFLKYDRDSDDFLAKKIIASGSIFINLINLIENDTTFWQYLCHHYNELVKKLVGYQEAYIQAYSDSLWFDFNEEDKKAAPHLEPVTRWSLLREPDYLIALMNTRNIRQITSFQNQVGASAQSVIPALRTVPFISNPMLALDYLQRGSFSARQIGTIDMPYIINSITGPDFNEVDAKLNERGGKHQEGDTVFGKAGMEFFRRSALSNERVTEWVLPVHISVNMGTETADIATFDFHGSYADLAVDTRFWLQYVYANRYAYPRDDLPRLQPKYSMPGGGPASYGYDLLAAIPGYIKHSLEQSTLVHYENAHPIAVGPAEAKARELINNYFVEKRKKIAEILNLQEDNYGGALAEDRQKFHSLYKNTLIELDIHVRLIQLFAYLIGKDPNSVLMKTLCTSTRAREMLTQFGQQAVITTPLLLMPELIGAEQIHASPDLTESQMRASCHPRHLFEQICIIDDACRKSEFIYQRLHPEHTIAPVSTITSSSSSDTPTSTPTISYDPASISGLTSTFAALYSAQPYRKRDLSPEVVGQTPSASLTKEDKPPEHRPPSPS